MLEVVRVSRDSTLRESCTYLDCECGTKVLWEEVQGECREFDK